MVNTTTMTSINPFPTLMHSKMSSTGRPMDEISEFLLFTVTDGGHFGFYDLKNSTRLFKRGVGANFFIFTNTLRYLKQLSNVTCRRLVTESWFWTLLIRNCLKVTCTRYMWGSSLIFIFVHFLQKHGEVVYIGYFPEFMWRYYSSTNILQQVLSDFLDVWLLGYLENIYLHGDNLIFSRNSH